MRNENDRALGATQSVYPFGDCPQRIDIKTGVRLIQDGQLWLEHRHLEYLVAFLLATRKAFVDGAIHQGLVHVENLHLLANHLEEIHCIKLIEPAMLSNGVQRRSEKVHIADAGDLDRILKGEEHA